MANVLSVLRRIERLEEKAPKSKYTIIDYKKILYDVSKKYCEDNGLHFESKPNVKHTPLFATHEFTPEVKEEISQAFIKVVRNAFKKAQNKHGSSTILIDDL